MSIDISVVIPTVNREKILQKTLEALAGQTYPKGRYEIIVVDDGSTDNTKNVVENLCKGVLQYAPTYAPTYAPLNIRYIRQIAGKKGPASANNLGIRSALGEYILFLNDDVIADRHLIEEHMSFHVRAQNIAPQRTGIIVQGRVVNTSSLEDLGKKHEGYSGGYSDLSFGYFTTWNCSIKTMLLLKAGLFDEDFVDLCWEDVELGYRLRKLGVKQKYNKKAFGYHYKKDFDLKDLDWVKTKSVNMGRNAMIYYRKHPKLDVKISTQSFWLPMGFRGMLSIVIRRIGREKIVSYLKGLEKRKKHRLLGFFVGLAGYYWYLTGVRQSSI